jgi:hypothetical protein
MKTPKKLHHFFVCAVLTIYIKEGIQKQRHINILLETSGPNLTRKDLGSISQNSMARLHSENAVPPEDIKDVVILSITPLGKMSPDAFYGKTADAA